MNPLTPENLLASVLPGLDGIRLDVYTAMVGVIGLLLILIALDLLKGVFSSYLQRRDENKLYSLYESQGDGFKGNKDGFQSDMAKSKYQRAKTRYMKRG